MTQATQYLDYLTDSARGGNAGAMSMLRETIINAVRHMDRDSIIRLAEELSRSGYPMNVLDVMELT